MKIDNISLRGVKPEDVSFLIEIENDMNNWFVSGTRNFFNEKTIHEYANSVHDIVTQGQYRFVVSLDTEPIGTIDLFEFDPINKRVGVGIILKQGYRSQGYASKSLRIVIDYCRQNLLCNQVYCNIQANNEKSISLFEKLGFKCNGRKKDWYLKTNEAIDELFYQFFFDAEEN